MWAINRVTMTEVVILISSGILNSFNREKPLFQSIQSVLTFHAQIKLSRWEKRKTLLIKSSHRTSRETQIPNSSLSLNEWFPHSVALDSLIEGFICWCWRVILKSWQEKFMAVKLFYFNQEPLSSNCNEFCAKGGCIIHPFECFHPENTSGFCMLLANKNYWGRTEIYWFEFSVYYLICSVISFWALLL